MMNDTEGNKQTIRSFIQAVWNRQDLSALEQFWTEDCINHAMPGPDNRGLVALGSYHEAFLAAFAGFADMQNEIVQQVAEGDRVVTHLLTQGQHSGPFMGLPPTGRRVSMTAIRIDQMRDGKIAEHWSVGDLAGLMQQIQA